MVVRPANLPPSPADAAFSIIRLSGEALRTAPRLDEVLANIPGVSLFRRTSSLGANPTSQGVSLRGVAGSGASRALVTLDGVPQNDPFGGWVIWTRLNIENIEAATVVRGAGAGPYGAGALTGVIAMNAVTTPPGDWAVDGDFGSLGLARGGGALTVKAGRGVLRLSAAGEHSDGWTPVVAGRGAADRRLTLDDREIGLHFLSQVGAATQDLRATAFEEERGAGLAGAHSRERGFSASASAARPPEPGAPGWRAQAWIQASDLANTSVTVAADRQSATLSNNQYATPALGYGANAALRGVGATSTFEVGVDIRGAAGEDRERFAAVSGVLTKQRLAGGQTFTGGLYGEATLEHSAWLFTAGGRLDGWGTFNSHRLESLVATGAQTLNQRAADRGGVLPSGRLGGRVNLGASTWFRTAAYTGFRAPTLNELFRPFRQGSNITEANSALTPERLYGAEIGAGGQVSRATWTVTAFYNLLDNPVTNVTLARGPFLDPVEGFVPAGGALLQRRNVGSVKAYGLEAEAAAPLGDQLKTSFALSLTHARVDGGVVAPQLTGRIPTETPGLVVTGGVSWTPVATLTLSSALRYEGKRFDDDRNTLRLPGATMASLRAEWRPRRGMAVFVEAANLLDAAVATGETGNGVFSYGPPRTVTVGFSLNGPGGL